MFVDTSGLLCYFDRSSLSHADAATFLRAAPTRLTHWDVLAEFIPLCQSRRMDRGRALLFVADLLRSPYVEVVSIDALLHRAAVAFLQARLDKTYSICDAVSFLLMRQRGIMEALTTDRHFEQEGFVRLLK